MKIPDEHDLGEELRAVLDELPLPAEHPAEDTLLELTLGGLAAEQAEELHAHVEVCRVCQQTLKRLLEIPEEPPRPEDRVGPEETQAAWQRLASRITEETGDPAVVEIEPWEQSPPPPATWHWRRPAFLYAAMAALMLLSFGLGRFSGHAGSTRIIVSGGDRPHGLATSHLLSERHIIRGPEDAMQSTSCPRQNENFRLVLFDSALANEGLHDLKIEGPSGAPRQILELAATGNGELDVLLMPHELPNGSYVIEVFKPGSREARAEFQFSVDCP